MVLELPADADTLVATYLRSVPEVVAALGGAVDKSLVRNGVPAVLPGARLTRIASVTLEHWGDGTPAREEVRFQIDSYADVQSAASLLARTIQAALALAGGFALSGLGAITGVRLEGAAYQPEDIGGKLRARYRNDVTVWVRR